MRERTLVALGVALFVSALAIVDVQTHYLLLFKREQHLVTQRDALRVEWGRLLLEQGTLTEQRRVERIARDRLHMVMPNPRRITLLYTQAALTP